MDKKEQLIENLWKERHMLAYKGRDTLDHELAIEYLKNNDLQSMKANLNISDEEFIGGFELLSAAVNDIETLYLDYDCVND